MTEEELNAIVEARLAERLAARLAAERARVREEVVLALRREASRERGTQQALVGQRFMERDHRRPSSCRNSFSVGSMSCCKSLGGRVRYRGAHSAFAPAPSAPAAGRWAESAAVLTRSLFASVIAKARAKTPSSCVTRCAA